MSDQQHLDTAARALGALSPEEARAFDEHLTECDPCTVEFTGFMETLALVAAAAAQPAPTGLREKVMRGIAITAQLPPLDPTSAGNDHQSQAGNGPGHGTVTPIRRWYRRPTTLLLAAAAAAVLVAGGVTAGVLATRDGTDSLVAMEQCVQSAPDAQILRPSDGSGGQVKMATSCKAAIVEVGELPPVQSDKGYQLWVMAGSDARSVGMVQEGTDRLKSTFVTPLRDDDTDVGISVEPVGGSEAPTTSPMWVVSLHA